MIGKEKPKNSHSGSVGENKQYRTPKSGWTGPLIFRSPYSKGDGDWGASGGSARAIICCSLRWHCCGECQQNQASGSAHGGWADLQKLKKSVILRSTFYHLLERNPWMYGINGLIPWLSKWKQKWPQWPESPSCWRFTVCPRHWWCSPLFQFFSSASSEGERSFSAETSRIFNRFCPHPCQQVTITPK